MNTRLSGVRRTLLGNRENTSLLILIVLLLVMMAILNPGRFYRVGNLRSMASQMPELGFLSLGMMIVMITGGINLSVIATANMAGIATAMIMAAGGGPEATSGTVLVAIVVGLAVAAIVGLANGSLVAYVGVSPILATLGMMTLLNGVMTVLTRGYVISGFPPLFQFIGNGRIAGVPFPLILLILVFIAFSIVMKRTPYGLELYLQGSNETAAAFSGIRTRRVLLKTYVLSALLSGIAGMVMISRFNSAKFDYGESYLLITVLAAVLGGTDVYGGFGKTSGLFLSLVILQIVSSGLNLLQVNAFLTRAIWGGILVTVMIVNFLRNRGTVR
jgi:ribose/xylose/arabinose/galactoside ABC-type transport system permease subunit